MEDFNLQPNIQGPITTADSLQSGRLKVDASGKRKKKLLKKIIKKQ